MRDQILQFPEQLSKGIELAKNVKIDKTFEKVIVCGMGGSSIAGEVLVFWQETSGMPPVFCIHRDYDLPSWISENDLVVCISWSGNTEETLSSYESAVRSGAPVVSITTGGKLADISKQNGTPLVLLPSNNLRPRMGVGYMTAALFQLLGLEENISSAPLDSEKSEEKGKQIAEKINEMTPLLYSSYKWRIIPKLWKILFNENSKIHSFWNYFPGVAHNELVGFSDQAQDCFFSIFFKDSSDDQRQNKNIDAAIAILKEKEYNYTIIDISSSGKPLEAVLNCYILSLWTSFYLTKKIGVDPENIALLDEFKKLRG